MPTTTMNHEAAARPLVSVLMPAYNEGALLAQALEQVHRTLCGLAGRYRTEIVVVDDGSQDDTGAIANTFAGHSRGVQVVRHPVNLGLGQALRTGFAHCAGDYIVVLDADLSYAPSHIEPLVETLRATRAHVAVASPYMKGGHVTNVPPVRALLSRWANKFLAAFCPHADVSTLTGMVRGYDGTFLRALNLRSLGLEINTEILYKTLLLRGRIVEVPAHLDWTLQRRTPIRRLSSFRVLRSIVTYILAGFIFRPFMFFALPGLALGLVALYMAGWTIYNVATIYPAMPAGEFWDDQFSTAVAHVFAARPHAFVIGGVVALLSLQLMSLGFLSYQSKRYFEELFHLASGIRKQVMAPPPQAEDASCCEEHR